VVQRQSLLAETKELLRRYGVRPRRRLGQNFIVSRGALRMIIDALGLGSDETVVEIGAGLGTLTLELASRAGKVVAIEIDRRLIKVLEDRLGSRENVELVCGDVLSMKLPHADKVVSNVPYSISSKLLVKLLREPVYKLAVLTFQKEFALRLVAPVGSGNYGRISVIAQLYADMEIVGSISRRAFYPQPEVDSLVVRLKPRVEHREFFEKVERLTSILFSQRRRKLLKVLRKAGLSYGDVRHVVDLSKRVYELSPNEILAIAKMLIA